MVSECLGLNLASVTSWVNKEKLTFLYSYFVCTRGTIIVTTSASCSEDSSLLPNKHLKFKMSKTKLLIFPFQTYSFHGLHISIVISSFHCPGQKPWVIIDSTLPLPIGHTFQTQTECNHFSLRSTTPQPCSKNHSLCLDYSNSFLIDLLFQSLPPPPTPVYSQNSSSENPVRM